MFHPNCCVFQSIFAQYIVSLCCGECRWFRNEIQLNLKIFFVPFGFFFLSWENTNSCICGCTAEVTPSLCMNCKNWNKSCCQTSLVAHDNQSITDSSRVAALLPTGPERKNKMSISSAVIMWGMGTPRPSQLFITVLMRRDKQGQSRWHVQTIHNQLT